MALRSQRCAEASGPQAWFPADEVRKDSGRYLSWRRWPRHTPPPDSCSRSRAQADGAFLHNPDPIIFQFLRARRLSSHAPVRLDIVIGGNFDKGVEERREMMFTPLSVCASLESGGAARRDAAGGRVKRNGWSLLPPLLWLGTVAMRPSQVGGGASAGFPTATSCSMAAELSQVVQGYSWVQSLNLDLRLILPGIMFVKNVFLFGFFFYPFLSVYLNSTCHHPTCNTNEGFFF